ncbi:MAG: glycosyltransferase [Opitutaceae bacterium]|nr:glycosyltransferase [Opitutaceae bacterium]
MIFFDTTKSGAAGHRSGLTRVNTRLREELAARATATAWADAATRATRDDWFFTTELFSEEERPGFSGFLAARPCRLAAVFHDAIPLKHPHITWPRSVARHPGYMKLLAQFDRVWAVSGASREELLGYWRWLGLERLPPVEVLPLGADFNRAPRVTARPAPAAPRLLCVGILEPRKNQSLLLAACEDLWAAGLTFELHLVGRVNPQFGRPIAARVRDLQRTRASVLHFHEAADDAALAALHATARATVFPTIAEGCGLPLLESLWQGVPCVCSDLPVLRENAGAGGCLPVAANDRAAWREALRRLLTDDAFAARLAAEATARPLPTWRQAADTVSATLA